MPLDELALRRRPKQDRSRMLIAGIVDAAERLLATDGVEALTTTRIAAEAGIAVGSLYQYFPDKEAIIDAVASRYLEEFELLMDELVDRALREGWTDVVDGLIDAYAQQYRSEPGYRALWFGRHLSDGLREADRVNKQSLAAGVHRLLVESDRVRNDDDLFTSCYAAVLCADALLQEAFREDPEGEPALLDEAKRILRSHLADVMDRYKPRRRKR